MTPLALGTLLLMPYFISLSLASALCYYPDGEIAQQVLPCVSTIGTFSMCCDTARTSALPDLCLPNGLCQDPCTEGTGCTGAGQVWREACSDPTWTSPFCLKDICTDPTHPANSANGSAPVTQCPDGTWCCSRNDIGTSCCATNMTRFDIAATIGVSTIGTSAMGVSALNSTTSSAIEQHTSHSKQSTSHNRHSSTSHTKQSGLTTIQKIELGAGIGGGVLCVLVASIAFVTLHKRYRQKQLGDMEPYFVEKSQVDVDSTDSIVLPKAELDADNQEKFQASNLYPVGELP